MKKSPAEIEALRDAMDAAELDFRNAKIAFHAGADYKSRPVNYDELRRYVEAFIATNHDFQRARWGRVRVTLNPSNLLRE
jgi:hypothetical protein